MDTSDKTQDARAAGIPKSIWVLGFVSLLMDISSEMIHSLLPLFLVTGLGASALTLGAIEGLGQSTALIIKVFSGALSDYLGNRKNVVLFGYAMGAATKPVFALASGIGMIFSAKIIDRVAKGIRSAPRDALIADLTPKEILGSAFGLRQSLDTVGAILGPLVAVGLMLLWANDFRAVFWMAVIPGALAALLFAIGIQEPARASSGSQARLNPITRSNLKRMSAPFWWITAIGGIFTLARFSEAFLVLRAEQTGAALALVPLVMVVMNLVYASTAFPFGKLSDKMSHRSLLTIGLLILFAADLVLANSTHWSGVMIGVALWGVHMGISQGLLATMVASAAPEDLRGTAFGFFNLVSGIAMLTASLTAGFLWDKMGAASTFYAGAIFCMIALVMLLTRPRHQLK
jgi:MFS family permease